MRQTNKFISLVCMAVTTALLLGCATIGLPVRTAAAGRFSDVGGWFESLYAEIDGISDEDVTGVSWSGTASGSLAGEDLAYLVRDGQRGVRIDIPGLKAGTYHLTVTTKSITYTQSNISVTAFDRSGFAHFNYTQGVGAYNDDGSLKSNAVVIYVTDENKDSVSITSGDGTRVIGIGNILNTAGKANSNGTTGSGGKANTNQDILRKITDRDNRPLVIRLVGRVTAPAGLTAWNSIDYGGGTDDNGFMARMSGCKNITIEGIGCDTIIDGWGISAGTHSGDYSKGLGKSFEFRNIAFQNVPEDCIGIQGTQSGTELTDPVERVWVHNCTFYGPSGIPDASEEQDKGNGDGACDFNRGRYFTMSYCCFDSYRKTSLVGGSETSLQYHVTWHHNYWKNCKSRIPLGRHANMHMYNNFIEGQQSSCMAMYANMYIFSEYNTFLNCNKLTDGWGNELCKSFENVFVGCSGTQNSDLVQVSDKSQKVNTNNLYANFDTDPTLSYIASGNYALQTSTGEARQTILAYAGVMKETLVSPEEINPSLIPSDRTPASAVKLPYSQALTSSYLASESATVDNIVFHVYKRNNNNLIVGGTNSGFDIVFRVDTAVTVKMGAVSGGFQPALYSSAGKLLLTGSGTVYNLSPGDYFIQSASYSSNKYEQAAITSLSITPYDPSAPTQPPTEETIPVADPSDYIHNFTKDEKQSTFYAINGNLSTQKGTVIYEGLTMTGCLKLESATSISFTAPKDGQLHMIFHKTGYNVNAVGQTVGFDGDKTSYTVLDGGDYAYVTISVSKGSHLIQKGSGQIFLYYMAYTPETMFELAGANLVLGNDLTMNFALLASNLSGTDYYAEIVKHNPDGTTETTTHPFSTWTPYAGGSMYLITLDGLVAKQMSDKVEVTIYTTGGEQASYTWEDSIRDYAIRQLNNASNSEKVYTVVADMLNYGAAAQTQFGYNTSDLANATMTDAHKAYATAELDYSQYDNYRMVDDNYFGTILALETNIQMGVFFYDTAEGALSAKVSYRDHNGNAVSYEIAEADFDTTYAANGLYGIIVDTLVAGDVYQLVSVEIYKGDNRISCVEESMESYVVRQSGSLLPIYDALMKFMVSSYNYSH